MFLNAGGNGKDVRVENDVARVEADADQNLVGAFADFGLALVGIGLALFIEGHDHNSGAIAHAVPGALDKFFFALLEADGIHHGLALDAAQTRLDDVPLGGIDHDGHAGDVRLGRHQVQEGDHHLLRLQHALIHIDIDNLGAVLNLVPGNAQGFLVLLFLDQPEETLGTGHVGALTYVDKQNVVVPGERLEAGQAQGLGALGDLPGRVFGDRLGDGFNMVRTGTAAATNDVQEAVPGKAFDDFRHFFRGLIVFAKLIGKAGVRVGAYIGFGLGGELFNIGSKGVCTQRAVQADGDGSGVGHGVPESFGGLAGEGPAGGIGNGA